MPSPTPRVSHPVTVPVALLITLALAACGPADDDLSALGVSARSHGLVGGEPHSGHPSVGKLIELAGSSMCTATLIGDRTVLTAAHCVKPGAQLFEVGGRKYQVIAKHRHPGYEPDSTVINYDVGVLRLATMPDVLPSTISTREPSGGALATMVGYGRTDDETKDSGVKRLTTHTIDRVTATELHFFGHSPTQGNICSGDSGGPSFATINGYEVQVGVHSSSVGGCGNEGQDARVDAFAAWITTKAGGDVYQDGATPVRDHGPPRVSILSPTHNALTGTSVTVSASISDDTGVRRAALLVDGRELIGLLRSPFDFRVSALPPGVATVLTVVAEDTVGNEARATITITPTTAAAPGQARPSAPAPWGPPPLSARRAVGGCAVFHTDARSSAPVLFALLCLALRVRLLGGRRARRQ